LGEVREELVLVLEKADEAVGWRESVCSREYVLGYRVEYRRVFAEKMNIEHFLRITQAEIGELRIKSGVFGTKIRDSKTGGYLFTRLALIRSASGTPTPAPVSTMMFFDFLRRATASSMLLYCSNFTLFSSSRVMPRPRRG